MFPSPGWGEMLTESSAGVWATYLSSATSIDIVNGRGNLSDQSKSGTDFQSLARAL